MSNNLTQVIFDQFLDVVLDAAKKTCPGLDKCAFNYCIKPANTMNIIYTSTDECCRSFNTTTVLDITNICYGDLTSDKWIGYLYQVANILIADICPKKYVFTKVNNVECPPDPPKWTPYPTKLTTTIIKPVCPPPDDDDCEVINEVSCECIPSCPRVFNSTPRKILIKEVTPPVPFCCGQGFTSLASDGKKQFGIHKGNVDYNNHQWWGKGSQTAHQGMSH